jgi:CBS domain-containing protein
MGDVLNRFERLRARDCMTRQVVTIGADYSLRDAAMVLRAATVSGAPVVDGEGRPLGVLSSTDIVTYTQQASPPSEAGAPKPAGGGAPSAAPQDKPPGGPDNGHASPSKDWDLLEAAGFEVDQLPATNVKEYMSRQVISVTEEATLLSVARILCEHHIHRVLVVDGENRMKGIISSLDLLAAMVHTADEAGSHR